MKISVHEKEGNTVHAMVTYFAFGHHSALNLSPPQVSSLMIVDLQPNSTLKKKNNLIFNPDLVSYLTL